jgi:hypothetical protein
MASRTNAIGAMTSGATTPPVMAGNLLQPFDRLPAS